MLLTRVEGRSSLAKSSDYKTLARGIAAQWIRAYLISDFDLVSRLLGALEAARTKALKLEEEELKVKA